VDKWRLTLPPWLNHVNGSGLASREDGAGTASPEAEHTLAGAVERAIPDGPDD
jgi:hypothetical protein